MKKTRRSAFTIVELVIVIAVISVLSAVLIPTFGSIIKSANVASDQTTAANLTTELHIYLKGNVITSEADLIKALNDPELGFNADKLTPKTSNYGYHYWYDMENQTIIVETSDEISKKPVRRDPNFANSSFRDVYGTGYYLIDMSGDIADIINGIDNIGDASDYVDIIEKIESAATESNDTKLAQDIKDAINNTTIKNEAGSFFTNGESKNEYFSAGSTYIGSNYVDVNTNEGNSVNENATAAPAPSNPVEIPSHIDTAHDGSLIYDEETKIKFDSEQQAQDVLANGACGTNDAENNSNTNVTIGDTTYKPDENGNLADENGEKETITLTTKLPFAEFVVGTPDTKDTFANDKIYVAYRNKYLQLHAVNAANANEVSNKVESWEIISGTDSHGVTIEGNTGRLDISGAEFDTNNVCEVVVKATANNMNGEARESSITVVVVKPITATISIGSNNVAFVEGAAVPTLTFNGVHTSYAITIKATYSGDSAGNAPLQPTPSLEVSELDGLIYENKKLTFQTKANGELLEGANFWFTATVDGCFSKKVDVDVIDATAAAVKFNYMQESHAERPVYYIGSNTSGTANTNTVKLSDLFTVKNTEKFGSKAKMTIYANAETSGYLSPKSEINKLAAANAGQHNNQYTLTATYPKELTIGDAGNWSSAVIEFVGNVTGVYNIFIEIAPENDVSTVVNVKIVNGGTNVTTIDGLAKTHTTDVVLHKDVTAESKHKIVLGAKALYGNGWIITADKYVSSLGTDVITDSFISVNGGKVDNVYINGPVYPTLDYSDNANKYHVSGIRSEGESTVTNSYVSGFRQPIAVNGGKLTLDNVTLYGGNYANLQLIKGNLEITDVTTVQPESGIEDTFNDGVENEKKNVIGLGIVVENDAIASNATANITIKDGYLDQYNWVSEDATADLPTVVIDGAKMDFKIILAAMFDGIKVTGIGDGIDRRLNFLDAYMKNVNGVRYLNTGIIFMSISTGDSPKIAYGNIGNLTVTDNRTSSDYVDAVKFGNTLLPLFSEYELIAVDLGCLGTMRIYASQMMRALELFTIDETTGKATGALSTEFFQGMTNEIDVCLKIWSYKAADVNLGGAKCPINWTQGYYINYGN